MKSISIIKIGGKVINDAAKLSEALDSFCKIPGGKILIHGGGSEASSMAKKMDVPVTMIEGRRITDDAMLEIVTMIYAGKVNKNIVAQLQARNCNALGLSGADGNTIESVRRPVKEIDYGNVGDVKNVNGVAIANLLKGGFVPVFCALTHDGKGNMLNTNADTIASEIAKTLAKSYQVKLCYTFELKGVLQNFEDKNSVIPLIKGDEFQDMKAQKVVNEGMIPKIHNALEASKNGVQKVFICQYSNMNQAETGTQLCYQ
ncbi:acetylglutamate kinase [Portibacter lacus]|uniref:Acetylglutamate kinase n=1 Tax=Portibacter lacus TaxID=1099794 RepID=A0AA37SQ52_9BACT|nr:acetylglutamate kinase [Portibacter lacus]GLR17542.1 acetylglutamate kinase [Portibacter lacus]